MARILVVDDEHSIRVSLREFLRDAGHEVDTAEQADEAMEMLAAEDFDVVVTDIILPRITGVSLLKSIKEISPHVQVILMTGEPTVETASEAVRSGAFDYLSKPIGKERLLRTVANAAKLKSVEAERRRLIEENRQYQQNLEKLVELRTAALSESSRRYRELFEMDLDAVAITVQDGRFVDVNPAFLTMFGHDWDDLEPLTMLDIYADPADLAEFQRVIEEEGLVRENAAKLRKKDGTEIEGLVSATVRRGPSGESLGCQAVFRDISEKKLLEEQLRQSQKLEAVGQLAGGVAHDFNNLLTGITGYAQLVLGKIDSESLQATDLRKVLQMSNRAASLTRQLLAFSRRQTLEPRVFALGTLIEDSSKVLTRLIGENIEVELSLAPDAGNVYADPGQIEQILFNLVINARDAMPEGGKLTLETTEVKLDEEYCDRHIAVVPGRYVMLAVTDTGCGMDAETREQIFEPFFTTKEQGKGTGLGLAVVYGIVKQHEGNIWAYSEPGRGTTFKVYLPRVEAEAEEIGSEKDPGAAPTGSETILVVEDEEDVRVITERELKEQGYRVYTAATPSEAEALYSKHGKKIDLLLTDVVLPEMDGPSLFARISEQAGSLKVLYMSGYAGGAVLRNKLVEPEASFIQKPFTHTELARKVREALDKE